MSELIDNTNKKRDLLKHLILQLHRGEAPDAVRNQLVRLLGEVPYERVVEVEQELISEGLPAEEVLSLCDVHTEVLKGKISHEGARVAPVGHPVHTFKEENRALQWEVDSLRKLFKETSRDASQLVGILEQIQVRFNALADVEKHYQRKENLLFPFLEKHGVTGPPKVMWGKHDETRELLKAAFEALENLGSTDAEELLAVIELVFEPAVSSVEGMIFKEEQILFPMSLDTLEDREWYAIYRQSPSVGFCLFDPDDDWKPDGPFEEPEEEKESSRVQLPSGSLTAQELNAILNAIPFDLTFVDKDDTVRYFTQGRERIFTRTRAILGRKVQLCHPPSSVHIVEKILSDFHAGKESRAPFWITLNGQFIHIEYFALRDEDGAYLGTLEVSQNLTEKRELTGEQRLLSYVKEDESG